MKVWTDANPTHFAIVTEDGTTRSSAFGSPKTNNEAEYAAIVYAITAFEGNLEIYSDSRLVVSQLNHRYHIREDRLRELAIRIWNICINRKVSFNWIPRKENLAGKVLK